MKIIDSDVFIFKDSFNAAEVISNYQKHLKFCLKKEFFIGLPFEIDEETVSQFKTLTVQHEATVDLFFYFDFKPHQSIQSIVEKFQQSDRWSQHIHLLPHSDLQYGSYKEEIWDLHLEKYSVYFHELNHVKEFSKILI